MSALQRLCEIFNGAVFRPWACSVMPFADWCLQLRARTRLCESLATDWFRCSLALCSPVLGLLGVCNGENHYDYRSGAGGNRRDGGFTLCTSTGLYLLPSLVHNSIDSSFPVHVGDVSGPPYHQVGTPHTLAQDFCRCPISRPKAHV
ncbi:hypothetical protein AAHC03_0989 [Spirometra sp. Aus1]